MEHESGNIYLHNEKQMGLQKERLRQSRDVNQQEREPERYKKERRQSQKKQVSAERKWHLVLDVQQFQPEEVKVKVDTVYHTLIITAQRINNPWQQEQQKCNKLKRVVPLPENINLAKLRVKFTPCGELVVKAPFQYREDGVQPQQYKPSGSAKIPITFKDATTSKRSLRQLQPNQPQQAVTADELVKCSVQEYLRLLKNTAFPNTMETQCVQDETTGQWKVLIDINTIGFRQEEVQVKFQEKEHLLIVDAKHELKMENQPLQGISNKHLRREFILPEWLEGKQMRYRVMNNGVLRIQLPCLRDPSPASRRRSLSETEQQTKRV